MQRRCSRGIGQSDRQRLEAFAEAEKIIMVKSSGAGNTMFDCAAGLLTF